MHARLDYAVRWLLAEDSSDRLDAPESPWPRLHTRLLQDAAQDVGVEQLAYRSAWVPSPHQYARQLGLVQPAESLTALSMSGDLALRLAPADTVRWLLALEQSHCTGPEDSWRIQPSLVDRLRQTSRAGFSHRDWAFAPLRERGVLEAEFRALKRLQALQLVTSHEPDADDEYSQYEGLEWFRLTPHGRGALQDLAQGDSPLGLLAGAVSRDQAAGIMGERALAMPVRELGSSAVSETLRHMHLMAHESRNALVPVQVAFDQLWRRLPPDVASPALDGYRDTIRTGLRRMFASVDESARLARLAPSPPEPFDVFAAAREAVSAFEPEFEHEIDLDSSRLGTVVPLVLGDRRRFVLALVNLLRNALQANSASVKVGLTLTADSTVRTVSLMVDDNGRGIPAEHHAAIFERGFSLRPDGTGLGLALVREVIADEMRGTVACSASPKGGARFTLQLPSHSGGSP